MNTFGEIIEPTSRNVWEDWDDNSHEDNTQVIWQKDVEVSKDIKTLLIIEGRYLCDSINISECKLELINSVPEINLHLYKTNSVNNYICVIRDYNLVLSSAIIELLRDYITGSGDVVAILTKPLVEYQGFEATTRGYVARKLSTENSSKSLDMNFPKLEQPNIISGVSAGAISLRDNLGLPASAVVFYIENPEVLQVDELQKLLVKLNIVPHKSSNINILSSNLYI